VLGPLRLGLDLGLGPGCCCLSTKVLAAASWSCLLFLVLLPVAFLLVLG
jgi:hypothetical protein